MGQKELLLIMLGVVIVGIVVAAGIQMFGESAAAQLICDLPPRALVVIAAAKSRNNSLISNLSCAVVIGP